MVSKRDFSTLDRIIGPQGILSKKIANYEYRVQQLNMSHAVFESIMYESDLLVEAPTGTGKTLAYLIPAILSRRKIAISTGTKNLQEQLFFKDIPFLTSHVFDGLKVALLKGRSNFICHNRLRNYLKQPVLQGMIKTDSVQKLLDWYNSTKNNGDGDRSEIAFLSDDDPLWPEICSTTETCVGKKCDYRENCFVLRMKAKAQEADLMIVNHHLLCSDIAVKNAGYGEVIPRYECLIVDEAHGLEEAATQHFGVHLSLFRVLFLIRDIKTESQNAALSLNKILVNLEAVETHSKRLFEMFQIAGAQRSAISSISAEQLEAQETICNNLDSLASMLANLPSANEELKLLSSRSKEISKEFKIILNPEPDRNFASWMERKERYVQLHASPIEVGPQLVSSLFSKLSSTTFTSATLSSSGNFDYFRQRIGIDKTASELILDSPFDYAAQTMLYIPDKMPDPTSMDFSASLGEVLEDILKRTQGRAFVLFTSYKNLEIARNALTGKLSFPILVQGQKPKSKLLEEFIETPGAVLLATSSFWEGVDVQGEALSCVIIDRLPFAPPNDPIVAARITNLKQKGIEPFYALQIPMAVIALKQGLGRLIRTRCDKGVLAILDTRILSKSYGKIFIKNLHNSPLCRKPRSISDFFAGQKEPQC